MRIRSVLIIMLVSLGLVSCQPTIDTSSNEAFEKSVNEIHNYLEGDARNEFDSAMEFIVMAGMFSSKEEMKEIGEKIDGMTGSEVVAFVKENQ